MNTQENQLMQPRFCSVIEIDDHLLLPVMIGELDGKQAALLTLEKPEGVGFKPSPTDQKAVEKHWDEYAQRTIVFERSSVGEFRAGIKLAANESNSVRFIDGEDTWLMDWICEYSDGAALITVLDHVLNQVVEAYIAEFWGEWRGVKITGTNDALRIEAAKKITNWNVVGEA